MHVRSREICKVDLAEMAEVSRRPAEAEIYRSSLERIAGPEELTAQCSAGAQLSACDYLFLNVELAG